MRFLHNQKVAVKIICVLAVLLSLMLIIGGVGFYSAKNLSKISRDMYNDRLQPIELLAEIRLLSKDTEAKLLELIQMTDSVKQQDILKNIDENTKVINKLQEQYQATEFDSFEKQKFEELQKELGAYRQARAEIIKLATTGKNAEAFTLFESSKPVFAKALSIRADLSKYNSKLGKELHQQGDESASSTTNMILAGTLLAFLLAGALGIMLARAISIPLNKLVVAVDEIANGDLRDKPRSVLSGDEIGQLADSVVKMRNNLRQLAGKIRVSSKQVTDSAEELMATSEQSAQAANQVVAAITGVAHGADEQVISVGNVTSVIETMSASIEQMAANTSGVTGTTDKTALIASQGLAVINQATAQIASIEKTVTNSAVIVAQLGERSKDIGQIVETIASIASQTNLLALNAAIEAARAGEQGRGFAVVADEVRKLAEQSEAAAKQIASLIKETQYDTDKAVQAMQSGTQEVKVGTAVINGAGQTFREIVESITQVSTQIKELSSAIQYMAENSEAIVSDIHDIDKVTKGTAEKTQTASAATEEQSAAIEEIAASSAGLAQLAEELQGAIKQFQT